MPTLQEQVNIASSGAVIQHDTEFVGNLVINKPITIQGAGKIRTPNADPAVDIVPKTGPVTLRGLEICTTPGWELTYIIVRMGAWQTTSLADVPQGLLIDGCNIHGQPSQSIQQGVAANGANVVIQKSRIWEIHHNGADCQAIGAWNGPGPFKIVDNYLEASGENIMFGGAEARIPNLIASDIEVRRNHLFKPLTWCPFHSSYAGIEWRVKNLFELKNARRVIADGNVMENCWVQSQTGYAVLFTVRGEDGKNAWATIQDVVFTNNTIKNVPAGFQLLGKDNKGASVQGARLRVANNQIQFGSGLGSNGRLFDMQQYNDVLIENNEADPPLAHLNLAGEDPATRELLLSTGLIYRNNLVGFGEYGVFGDGDRKYTAFAPDAVISGNVAYGPTIPDARKIAGNTYVPSKPSTIPAGVGVDYTALKAAQSGTSAPAPAPAPSPTPTPAPAPSPTPSPTTSPNGTKDVKITDNLGRLWALGSRGETLRDSIHIANGFGTIYKWQDLVVYVFADGNWWKFNGEGWEKFGATEPGAVTQPSTTPIPAPAPTVPTIKKVAWPSGEAKQDAVIAEQWKDRYRLKRHLSGAWVEFEKVG